MTETQRDRHRRIHRQRDIHTDTYIDRETFTHTNIHRQKHRHTDTSIDRRTHTHTDTYIDRGPATQKHT